MIFGFFADVVVLVHAAFIVFVLLGGLLTLKWYWMPWFHLIAVAWGASVEIFGWRCPLTPLEIALRRTSGENAYANGFVEHYVMPIIYPVDLSREQQILLGCIVVFVNVAIYLFVWRYFQRRSVGNATTTRSGSSST